MPETVMLRRDHILFVIVLSVGLATRLYEISYSFTPDEFFSVTLAHHHLFEVVSDSLLDRTHPPLYNILLHFWMAVFGPSEISAHLLSVLLWCIFMILSYTLLRRFVDSWIALALLLIFALSPHFVFHGREARPYALIALLVAANLLALMRLLDAHNRRHIAMWAASCLLLVYVQHLGIIIIAFEIVFALRVLRSERRLVALYGSLAIALYLPWFVAQLCYPFLEGRHVLSGIDWMQRVHWDGFIMFYSSSVAGDLDTGPLLGLLALFVLLGLAYIIYFASNKKTVPKDHLILFLVAFGMPVIAFFISKYVHPVFVWRQLIGPAVAFVCVLGLCVATLPRKLAAPILLTLVVLSAGSLPQGFPQNMTPPWRDMAEQIDQRYGPITVVTHVPWVRDPLGHYRKMGKVQYLEDDLTKYANNDHFLIVCRPHMEGACSEIFKSKDLKHRSSLLKVWDYHFPHYYELRLYEVKASTKPVLLPQARK